MTIGERLLKCRKDKMLSQEDVAERIGVSRQAVSKWENDLSVPDTYNLIELSNLYGVSVEYFVRGDIDDGSTTQQKEENTEKKTPSENKKPISCLRSAIGFGVIGIGVMIFSLNIALSIMGLDTSIITTLIGIGIGFIGLKISSLL